MAAGKGDDRRPSQVSEEELARNWARIFDDGDRADKVRSRCIDWPNPPGPPYAPTPTDSIENMHRDLSGY